MISLSKEQIDGSLLKVEDGLNKYTALQENLQKIDVSKNRNYQKRFNHFYRVRRNADWQSHFYKLLQERKGAGVTFHDALAEMQAKTERMEASFASKLVATIHPNKPVIDKFVLDNTGFRLPSASSKNRKQEICSIYGALQKKFEDFLKTDNGEYLVERFKEKFPKSDITEVKMVDLILWQTR